MGMSAFLMMYKAIPGESLADVLSLESSEEQLPSTSLASELTLQEQQLLEFNQRIAKLNNAPDDYPSFVRNGNLFKDNEYSYALLAGYDVRVLTSPGYVETDSGLIYKEFFLGQDFGIGEGENPVDGQEIVFNYTAYNESGGTIDSTYNKGRPAETRLGIKGMIPGFEEGLKSMKPGGKRRIVVPPELGPPVGPSTFFSARQFEVFDVELLAIKNCRIESFAIFTSRVVCE
eukprot:gene3203-4048_t